MAKHKKKKSPPTPDPNNSNKKEDIPPTEKDIPPTEKENPPQEPIQTDEEKARYKKQLDKLFWIRIGLAVIAGTAATFIFEPFEGEERRWASIGFMIIIFIVSIGIGKGMKIQLPSSDRKKLITTAIGSFVFIYLFMWILSYTLVNLTNGDSGISSPFP